MYLSGYYFQRLMTTYIALLRGINVSGKNIIKMAALKAMFEEMNVTNVSTYIQSGNIIFSTSKRDNEKLSTEITEKIKTTFHLNVPVLVLSIEELLTIRKNNPFINSEKYDVSYLHVTLLSETPEQHLIKAINQDNFNDDFIIEKKAVYLYCSNGYGQTKLTNTFFENKLKVKATTRNWKTINEIINIAQKE